MKALALRSLRAAALSNRTGTACILPPSLPPTSTLHAIMNCMVPTLQGWHLLALPMPSRCARSEGERWMPSSDHSRRPDDGSFLKLPQRFGRKATMRGVNGNDCRSLRRRSSPPDLFAEIGGSEPATMTSGQLSPSTSRTPMRPVRASRHLDCS